MPYPREMYLKAERMLQRRRENSAIEAELRANEIRDKIPEIDEIQQKLSRIGFEISTIFLNKENTEAKLDELKKRSRELVEKRNAVLVKNGYSENAMSQEHLCPYCEDRGFVNGRMCSCHTELLKNLMREEIRKLAPIDSCTFDSFDLNYYPNEADESGVVPRARAEKILEACRRYAQNINQNSKSIMLLGKTGLGKTHLSLAIANVAINRGCYVCYGTSQNICEDLRSEMFGRDKKLTYTKDSVCDCDLLILDDLGTEIDNQYNIATLYNIINTRILSGKPTIISTNYELTELLDKYDQRITSRLMGEYTRMMIFGTDNRIK